MIGVSFQPGQNGHNGQQNGAGGSPSPGSGIQEAIKILSLRLPKVVGAQAVTPMPLLTSQGSGGNPRVDAIVNQILARMGQPKGPAVPGGPTFSGPAQTPQMAPQSPWMPPGGFNPRITVGTPPMAPLTGPTRPGESGTDANLSGGGQPQGLIAPLPSNYTPPSPFRRDEPSYAEPIPFEQPLF